MDNQETGNRIQAPSQAAHGKGNVWGIKHIKSYIEQRRAQKKKESTQDRAARQTANATRSIAFFTFVAICVGIAQWRALRDTDDKIGRQLTLIEADQRPWIGVDRVETGDVDEKGLKIRVILKNSGKTPALKWTAAFNQPYIQDIDAETPADKSPCGDGCSHGILVPNAELVIDISLGANDLNKATVGFIRDTSKKMIYILGRTDYFDTFDRPHKTKICMYYNPKGKTFGYCVRIGSNDAD